MELSTICDEEPPGRPLPEATDSRSSFPDSTHQAQMDTLAETASAILKRRQERVREFSSELFGEPAWEILLELFVRERSGVSTTTAQLKIGLGLTATAVARCLQVLEEEGLLARLAHPVQQGTEYIELTEPGREALARYLLAVQPIGS